MVIKIQRWSPIHHCDCVIDQFVEYDDEGNGSEPQFLLMNNVCEEHKHMASIRVSEKHAQFSPRVLNLIEEAKARNLKQVDDLLENPNLRAKTRRELLASRQAILQHNQDLDDEWGELVTLPHAFDEHIHDHIKTRMKIGNG